VSVQERASELASAELLASIVLQHQVEQFLYHEAELLDSWQWSEWLELFAEDIRYWMPIRKNRLRRQRGADELPSGIEMAHFDDDLASLRMRVNQLGSGRHWAEDPPSRTRHLVTNVRVRPVEIDGDELDVRSNFIVYRNRLETEVDIWSGARRDVLRPNGTSFEIARRTILIEQNVVLSKNLSVFF
jgi:biphenyl 2,3-dioxygenase subunit beta